MISQWISCYRCTRFLVCPNRSRIALRLFLSYYAVQGGYLSQYIYRFFKAADLFPDIQLQGFNFWFWFLKWVAGSIPDEIRFMFSERRNYSWSCFNAS